MRVYQQVCHSHLRTEKRQKKFVIAEGLGESAQNFVVTFPVHRSCRLVLLAAAVRQSAPESTRVLRSVRGRKSRWTEKQQRITHAMIGLCSVMRDKQRRLNRSEFFGKNRLFFVDETSPLVIFAKEQCSIQALTKN